MKQNLDTYFPERFVNNRNYITKAIKNLLNSDFDNYGEAYHELRHLIGQYVENWRFNIIPDELLDERDLIQNELRKYSFVLENPTEESRKAFLEQNREMRESGVWKKWQNWLEKTKDIIKVFPRQEEETAISKSIITFYKNGRNIFSISPFLTKLLNHTDVGNIRFDDIKLPYNSIYLHFGAIKEIELPIDLIEYKHNIEYELQDKGKLFYLDGAFVSILWGHSIDIRLTFIDPNDNFSQKLPLEKDFRFPSVNFTLDFAKWDSESKTSKLDSSSTFNDSTVCFSDIWDPKSEPSELVYNKLHSLTKEPEKCYDSEWKEYVIFDKSLTLIVNSLCYLNYINDDITVTTTNEQATNLITELKKTKKRQQRTKIEEKLKKFSYSKIHYLGHKVETEYVSTEHGYEVEPHWRRGHWRNQPFGQGLSSRKLIWIKPTIVRKDKGEPVQGHIYDV